MPEKNVLIIITGSIAAYKMLDVVRLLRKKEVGVTCVMTESAAEFVTPMSVAAISGRPVYDHLFSLKDECEMGHIRLAREHDLVVVAPASADIMAKMAHGFASDLASTILLATTAPIMVAPAMNVKMWENKAVQRNVSLLKEDGITFIGPDSGDLACGEQGFGRMVEPEAIIREIILYLDNKTA